MYDEDDDYSLIIPDEYRRCGYCRDGISPVSGKTFARGGSGLVECVQCVSGDDESPSGSVDHMGCYPFMAREARCPAFKPADELRDDLFADAALYAGLHWERWAGAL